MAACPSRGPLLVHPATSKLRCVRTWHRGPSPRSQFVGPFTQYNHSQPLVNARLLGSLTARAAQGAGSYQEGEGRRLRRTTEQRSKLTHSAWECESRENELYAEPAKEQQEPYHHSVKFVVVRKVQGNANELHERGTGHNVYSLSYITNLITIHYLPDSTCQGKRSDCHDIWHCKPSLVQAGPGTSFRVFALPCTIANMCLPLRLLCRTGHTVEVGLRHLGVYKGGME